MSAKIWCILVSFIFICLSQAKDDSDIAKKMIEAKIVPELLREAPEKLLRVIYKYGEVHPGETWLCNRTIDQPKVIWEPEPDSYYFLYFCSLNRFDQETLLYPYTKHPITTSEPPINVFELWVVSNIPGNDISKGNILVEYTCPGPPLHETVTERYIYLVYKQPEKNLTIREHEWMQAGYKVPEVENITQLEIEYGLGKPLFGNFFIL